MLGRSFILGDRHSFLHALRHDSVLARIARRLGRRWRRSLPADVEPVGSDASPSVAATHANVDRFEWLSERRLHLTGWAFGPQVLQGIAVLLGGREVGRLTATGVRNDVAAAFPGFAHARLSGFDAEVDLGPLRADLDVVALVALGPHGAQTTLLRRSVVAPAFQQRWTTLLDARGVTEDDVFYVPVATSHVAQGGADGIRETFGRYESRTVKAGIRVQILYLRTTLGAAADYVFDPDFIADKRSGGRLVAEDGLNDVIRYAITEQMPVLFTLNGGIWADSACEAVEWDVNDALERDEQLCQWNERNQVMPDNALANRPGSVESPELGRSLSLNVYMERMRFYKKRNLQHAAALIARFAAEHPALFIGVALDPDVYVNPFFEGAQWYDYNPATLRQFRQWLRGDGPYAGEGGPGVPDLRAYRRAKPLTLADVDALTGCRHADWDEVDPPRDFPTLGQPFWRRPWMGVWEQFRRQLVKLHYDELSQWVAEAGIRPERIYASQGFMPPDELIDPLPVRLDSPAKNYDSGGMSVEGSVPTHGRLGAIVYGRSAVNDIRMEGARSLFAEFRTHSPDWAVVEHNTANLTEPAQLAPYRLGYRSLREMANYGARLVSPMAWNGSPGETVGREGFLGYTSLRRSPLEEAIVHFMLARADLPRRARLWTFGAVTHADGDGWQVDGLPATPVQAGVLNVPLGDHGQAQVASPHELACGADDAQALVVQASGLDEEWALEVHADIGDGRWRTLCARTPWHRFKPTAAGNWVPLDGAVLAGRPFDRLRLSWHGQVGRSMTLHALALYPR